MQSIGYQRYEEYKGTGYDWLGEAPSHWTVSRLGRSLTPVSIKNHPELPLLSITREQGVIERDVEDQDSNHNFIPDDLSNYKLLRAGQFGMNKMKAWQGSYGVSQHTGIVSPAYYIFDFVEPIDPEFFNVAIRSKLYVSYFGSASDGVRIGQWDLNKMRMKEIPFLLPPLNEQKRIAAFLNEKISKIDQAISIKEQQIALLKERKQIIIQEAVTKGLNPNASMKDSGVDWIGEIPAHWEVKPLKRICEAFGRIGFRGYSATDLVNEGEGAITLSPSNLSDDEMGFEKCSYLSWSKYEESPEIQIFNGDILVVKTGSSFGKTGYVRRLPQPATINPQLLVLKNIKCNPEFLYHYISSPMTQTEIKRRIIGSTIPTFSEPKLLGIKMALPPADEQKAVLKKIANDSNTLDAAIAVIRSQIAKFKEYKTSLINEAVTGKIKVV